MEAYIFPLFLLLSISLLLSAKFIEWKARRLKLIRWGVTILGISFYTFWFIRNSFYERTGDAYSVEIINKLPQTIDFYIIKVLGKHGEMKKNILHSGKIRPDHYRLERLEMEEANELWLVGFLGKDNLVYFSQHSIVNKNIDSVIEVNQYIISSKTLSERAKASVSELMEDNYKKGIYISLSILFIFLNVFLLKKNRKSYK